MKKALLFIMLLQGVAAYSQIRETANPFKDISKVNHITVSQHPGGDYLFLYEDLQYTTIVDIKSFTVSNDDFEPLYNRIMQGFEKAEKEVILDMPKDMLTLRFVKNLGVQSVQISHLKKGSQVIGIMPYLTKKQVDKLFLKDK